MECLTHSAETRRSLKWRHQVSLKSLGTAALKRGSLGKIPHKQETNLYSGRDVPDRFVTGRTGAVQGRCEEPN